MATKHAATDPIEAIGVLNEPTRRRLYDLVAASPAPIGRDDGRDARRKPGRRPGGRRLQAELSDLLRGAGYDPAHDDATGTLSLRNCPYRALVAAHRGVTCGMNLAWAEGVIDGLGANVH